MILSNGDVGLQLELYIILFFRVFYRYLFLLLSLDRVILYSRVNDLEIKKQKSSWVWFSRWSNLEIVLLCPDAFFSRQK